MKYIKFMTYLGVLISSQFLLAQAPDTLWMKTFAGSNNEVGYAVQQTVDGGYIVAGATLSFGLGSSDIWLLKTNANGDTVWTRTYGGIRFERGGSMVESGLNAEDLFNKP
jgi:hypothetical protein